MVIKYFTFVWRIENFRYYWQKANRVEIGSPEFHINGPAGLTKWRLLFSDRPYLCHDLPIVKSDKYITLFILRTDDNEKDSFTKVINISVMRDDKSLYQWRHTEIKTTGFEEVLSRKAAEFLNRDDLLSDGALILVCTILKPYNTLNFVEEQSFARTLFAVEHLYFVAAIKEFSYLKTGLKRTVPIKSVSVDRPIFIMNVCLLDDGEIYIRISVQAEFIHLCFCKVFALEKSGNWKNCGQDSEWRKFGEVSELALTLDFNTSINKYIQNEVLTLKCQVTYTTEEEPQRFETIKYGHEPSEILQQISPCFKRTPIPETKKEILQSSSTLSEDKTLSPSTKTEPCATLNCEQKQKFFQPTRQFSVPDLPSFKRCLRMIWEKIAG